MTTMRVVTDEQLGQVARRQHDLFRRIRDGSVDCEQSLAGLQSLIEGGATETASSPGRYYPSELFVPELMPAYKGQPWKIAEDVLPARDLVVVDLEFVPVLEQGEPPISGQVMLERARERGADFGLSDAPAFLDQKGDIPEELRGRYIPLAGTVLRDPGDRLYVPYLYWSGGGCFLGFVRLDSVWDVCDRFALRK